MPGARTHDAITVITGLAMAPPAYTAIALREPEHAVLWTGLLVGSHLVSGIMFSPDLDLDSAIDERWGVFSWIWQPYTRIVPHRAFWSHGLILPPILRLLYFIGALLLLAFVLARGLALAGAVVPDYHVRLANAIVGLVRDNPHETLVVLAGFATGGAAHSIADWLVTGGKHILFRMGIRLRRDYRDHDRSIHRPHARRGAWGIRSS